MIGIIRKIIPKRIRLWRMIYLTFGADIINYIRSLRYQQDIYKSEIIMICHIIEKGLTMPKTRLGFGKDKVLRLCYIIDEYRKADYDIESFEINYALMVLNEYLVFHKKQLFELNKDIKDTIEKTTRNLGCIKHTNQLVFTRDSFTKSCQASFDDFSKSRHTVRNYTPEKIDINQLISAVNLAQNAPSSCNRQPVRVYIITKTSLIAEVLNLQGGNRGFGDLASALLVVTSNISLFHDVLERMQPSLNAGFFGMSLLYALHYKKIGAATLNWSEDKRKDMKLREILGVAENEQINFMISCGYLPDEFTVAASHRLETEKIIKVLS